MLLNDSPLPALAWGQEWVGGEEPLRPAESSPKFHSPAQVFRFPTSSLSTPRPANIAASQASPLPRTPGQIARSPAPHLPR